MNPTAMSPDAEIAAEAQAIAAFEGWYAAEMAWARRRSMLARMAAPRAAEWQGPPYLNRAKFRGPKLSLAATKARKQLTSVIKQARYWAQKSRNGA